MWNKKIKDFPFPISFSPFQGAERTLHAIKSQFWMKQANPIGDCVGGAEFSLAIDIHTTSAWGGGAIVEPIIIGKSFRKYVVPLWLSRPIKTLTLHNTHINLREALEFSPICELFCVVHCVLKHFTDRHPSAKVPVAHEYKNKTNVHICRRIREGKGISKRRAEE